MVSINSRLASKKEEKKEEESRLKVGTLSLEEIDKERLEEKEETCGDTASCTCSGCRVWGAGFDLNPKP